MPALLATAAIWKAMVREGLWEVPLIVESAQVFDTHHVALLVAAGASAVVPYLADQFAEAIEAGGTKRCAWHSTPECARFSRAWASRRSRAIATAISSKSLVCPKNSALKFFEDAADFPGQKSLDDLLADYLQMHTAAFSSECRRLSDAGLFASARARSFTPIRPKLCAVSTPTLNPPAPQTYSAFEELAEHQGRFSCAICWTLYLTRPFRWTKSSPSNPSSSVSAPRRCL